MLDKIKQGWTIFKEIALIALVVLIVWQGYQIIERLAGHEKEIQKVQAGMLVIDTNGKKASDDVKGLAALLKAPTVYHQYYSSSVVGAASYGERDKDPATGKSTGAQVTGTITMGNLLFEWNGKKYEIPSSVVENGWMENGQFRFNMTAKNEVKVKASTGSSLDVVFRGGYGSNMIGEQMRPYGAAELGYRIHLLK